MHYRFGTAAVAVLLGCAAPRGNRLAGDMAWHDTTVAVGSGDSIHVVYRGLAHDRSLVFIPGMGDTWDSYQELAAALPDTFGMLLLDPLGHGRSSKHRGSIIGTRQAEALGALFDSLDVRPFALIGHSYGGIIAQHYGHRNPDLPAAVLMASPATFKGTPQAAEFIAFTAAMPDTVPDSVLAFTAASFFGPVEDSVVQRYVVASRASPGWVWHEGVVDIAENDTRSFLGDWKPRTLIVLAENDKILPEARVLDLAAALPEADTVRIPRTSHAMHWERPDTVAVELMAFFARVAIAR